MWAHRVTAVKHELHWLNQTRLFKSSVWQDQLQNVEDLGRNLIWYTRYEDMEGACRTWREHDMEGAGQDKEEAGQDIEGEGQDKEEAGQDKERVGKDM